MRRNMPLSDQQIAMRGRMWDRDQEEHKIIKIELPVYGIRLEFDDERTGTITSDPMYKTCPECGKPDCMLQCFDDLEPNGIGQPSTPTGSDIGDANDRLRFNGAVDGILSMILSHAHGGIDIESPAYLEGIETAIQALDENL